MFFPERRLVQYRTTQIAVQLVDRDRLEQFFRSACSVFRWRNPGEFGSVNTAMISDGINSGGLLGIVKGGRRAGFGCSSDSRSVFGTGTCCSKFRLLTG